MPGLTGQPRRHCIRHHPTAMTHPLLTWRPCTCQACWTWLLLQETRPIQARIPDSCLRASPARRRPQPALYSPRSSRPRTSVSCRLPATGEPEARRALTPPSPAYTRPTSLPASNSAHTRPLGLPPPAASLPLSPFPALRAPLMLRPDASQRITAATSQPGRPASACSSRTHPDTIPTRSTHAS